MAVSSGVGTNAAPAAGSGPLGLTWAPIPAWQITSLQQLAAQGKLYGIPPQIIAVIADAEEPHNGGGVGINSSGYGGYFGLGTSAYPGGSVTTAQLNDPSPASFAAQAQVAASLFASLLSKNNNNPVAAEQAYQTGSAGGTPGEGAKLMSQYVGGQIITPGSVPAGSSSSGSPSGSGSSCTPVGPNLPIVGQIFTTCSIARIEAIALLGVGGLVLFIGVGMIAAAMGTGRLRGAATALPGPVGTAARVTDGQGRQIGAERRQRATRAQAQSDALERTAARGQESRARQASKYQSQPLGPLPTDDQPFD
ncbi:MAG TPA: hypothetical protein VN799_00075 [Acidimicrobiales bacterium]|nr:hypothetical protein [Acidimicrobiales bacterium]